MTRWPLGSQLLEPRCRPHGEAGRGQDCTNLILLWDLKLCKHIRKRLIDHNLILNLWLDLNYQLGRPL